MDSVSGQAQRIAYRELPNFFPEPGWVEQDPLEIWHLLIECLGELVESGIERPVAVGITNQRETVVLWNGKTGQPLVNAIVWQDRRSTSICEDLIEKGHQEIIRQKTGLVIDPYFSASKLTWLMRNNVVSIDKDTLFGTVDTWIIWNLTGGVEKGNHVSEPSNASRTLLYDISKRSWSGELKAIFDVPQHILPKVQPSASNFGEITGTPFGVLNSTPITAVLGDQQSALFGQACFESGSAKITFGTGGFLLMNSGKTRPQPSEELLTTIAWDLGEFGGVNYALEGAIFSAGSTIQWLRDGLGIIGAASETEALARSVDSSGGLTIVPAFTGLGSPWWDPNARGLITGITRGTTRAEFARAAIESIAYQSADVVEAIKANYKEGIKVLKADGGASVMDLLLQNLADYTAVEVVRLKNSEATACGAAWLAGLHEGVWNSLDEIKLLLKDDKTFSPGLSEELRAKGSSVWKDSVTRSLGWEQAR